MALYWAPALTDTLAAAGNAWLGRDPETGAAVKQPDVPGLPAITETPRIYGFHATLRPPMRLATGWEEFRHAAAGIAAGAAPFDLPPLEVAPVGGFLALRLTAPCPALHALADACIAGTDRHRLAPHATEIARRRAAGLSPTETEMLALWGYPYAMTTWSFHITLSQRLTDTALAALLPRATAHFAAALAAPRQVTEICIFTQGPATTGTRPPMLIAERLGLRGS